MSNICSICGDVGANFYYGQWFCLKCFNEADHTEKPVYCPKIVNTKVINGITISTLGFCKRECCMAYIYVKSSKEHYCKEIGGGCKDETKDKEESNN